MLGRIGRVGRGDVRVRDRRPRVESLERRDLLTGFTVTSNADSGPGSLRAAIAAADADNTVGADTISFQIGTGAQTIALQSSLPTITRTVAIDATTQPQAAGQSGSAPRIILDGTGAGAGANGLTLFDGGGSTIRGLAIVNFAGSAGGGGRGILAADAGGDTFTDDYLGIEPDGTTLGADAVGIEVRSPNNDIGATQTGATSNTFNLISGNTVDGVLITGATATGNHVLGDRIGTNAAGTLAAGNLQGVTVDSAADTVIGGTDPGDGNLISGNVGPTGTTGIGVYLTDSASNTFVQGNMIGTNLAGTAALSNVYGIFLGTVGGSGLAGTAIAATTIGGLAGNLISGNGLGIYGDASGSLIAGNLIGTDATGAVGIGNGSGIYLSATSTTIGGDDAAARNIIASSGKIGSGGTGLELSGDGDAVEGNYVGTNAAGTAALPNAVGISLQTTNTTIGGQLGGAGNLIAGNTGDGLDLDSSAGNRIYGNTIGTTAGGALGNGGAGIDVILALPNGATSTVPVVLNDAIGDPAVAGNTIAGNAGAGVAVTNSAGLTYSGLSIRGDDITGNGLLGIALGANPSVPTPGTLTITSVAPTTTGGTIAGVVGGTPGQAVLVDLYANAAADPSGYGEGQTYLGTAPVTIGPGGLAAFSFSAPAPLGANPVVSATVTTPAPAAAGADEAGSTSEFAADFPTGTPPGADLAVTQAVSAPTTTPGQSVTFTATVTNAGTAPASGVVFTDEFGTGLTNVLPTSTQGSPTLTGDNIVTVPIGDLAPGASATITVSAVATTSGSYTNTAGALGTTPETNYANNTTSTPYAIGTATRPTADLGLSVTPSASTLTLGGNLTYTITVTDAGPDDAPDVTVNDFLPTGATLVSATSSQGTANSSLVGNLLTSALGTLAAGASATLTLVITPAAAGSISTTTSVMSGLLDPTPGNNSVTTAGTVAAGQSTLSLSQTTNPGTGAAGQIQLFVVTVENTGTTTASGVTLVDALPAGSTYVYAGATTGAATTFSNNAVTSTIGTLAAGASATVILAVVPNGTTSNLSNFAGVVAAGDATPTPVFSTAALTVAGGTTATAAAGPGVTSVTGSRSNAQLVVGFNAPITPASATTKANYRLYDLGLTARAVTAKDLPIAFTTAVYNPTTDAVTLTPSRSINATHYYALVVVGTTARGIADTSGRKLVGVAGGAAGTNYSTTFLAGSLPQA